MAEVATFQMQLILYKVDNWVIYNCKVWYWAGQNQGPVVPDHTPAGVDYAQWLGPAPKRIQFQPLSF